MTSFLFLYFLPLYSVPSSYQPVFVLECKKNSSILEESCFKNIQFATNRMRDSGVFEDVLSISNNSFLYHKDGRVFPVSFSDQSFNKKAWFKKWVLEQYESEMAILTDKNQRFAIFYSRASNLTGVDCSVCREIKDTLNYSKINSYFYYEKEFTAIAEKNFLRKKNRVYLKYPVKMPLADIQSFNVLYNLQQDIYKIPGVKIVYSPVNIYSFITSALNQNNGQNPRENWSYALSLWDLSGDRRGGYVDIQNNEMYLDIYTAWNNSNLTSQLQKIINERLAGTGIESNILEDSGKFIRKTDDAQMENIKMVHDEKNSGEKNSSEKTAKTGNPEQKNEHTGASSNP